MRASKMCDLLVIAVYLFYLFSKPLSLYLFRSRILNFLPALVTPPTVAVLAMRARCISSWFSASASAFSRARAFCSFRRSRSAFSAARSAAVAAAAVVVVADEVDAAAAAAAAVAEVVQMKDSGRKVRWKEQETTAGAVEGSTEQG